MDDVKDSKKPEQKSAFAQFRIHWFKINTHFWIHLVLIGLVALTWALLHFKSGLDDKYKVEIEPLLEHSVSQYAIRENPKTYTWELSFLDKPWTFETASDDGIGLSNLPAARGFLATVQTDAAQANLKLEAELDSSLNSFHPSGVEKGIFLTAATNVTVPERCSAATCEGDKCCQEKAPDHVYYAVHFGADHTPQSVPRNLKGARFFYSKLSNAQCWHFAMSANTGFADDIGAVVKSNYKEVNISDSEFSTTVDQLKEVIERSNEMEKMKGGQTPASSWHSFSDYLEQSRLSQADGDTETNLQKLKKLRDLALDVVSESGDDSISQKQQILEVLNRALSQKEQKGDAVQTLVKELKEIFSNTTEPLARSSWDCGEAAIREFGSRMANQIHLPEYRKCSSDSAGTCGSSLSSINYDSLSKLLSVSSFSLQKSLKDIAERENSVFWTFGWFKWVDVILVIMFGVLVEGATRFGNFMSGRNKLTRMRWMPAETQRTILKLGYAPLVGSIAIWGMISTELLGTDHVGMAAGSGVIIFAFLFGLFPNLPYRLFERLAEALFKETSSAGDPPKSNPADIRKVKPMPVRRKTDPPDFEALKEKIKEHATAPVRKRMD